MPSRRHHHRLATALAALAATAAAVLLVLPATAPAATCADHPDQASAQRAQDTRDADGDGIYCEALPCPCAKGGTTAPKPQPQPRRKASCVRERRVVPISFSATRYPGIRDHLLAATAAGWPRILVLHRRGSVGRRERLLDDPTHGLPPRAGFDRDEYPPAIGRGAGRKVLMQGTGPVGWIADVAYVPSAENRSHGAALGVKLRRFCDGQRFRYVFF